MSISIQQRTILKKKTSVKHQVQKFRTVGQLSCPDLSQAHLHGAVKKLRPGISYFNFWKNERTTFNFDVIIFTYVWRLWHQIPFFQLVRVKPGENYNRTKIHFLAKACEFSWGTKKHCLLTIVTSRFSFLVSFLKFSGMQFVF